jgi:hypothetical protein
MSRRRVLQGLGGLAVGGLAAGTTIGASSDEQPNEQRNYAEIAFRQQTIDGTSLTVDRTYVEHDGFITIHTWNLVAEQNGAGTIIGVSGLLEAGENGEGREYRDQEIALFDGGTGFSSEFEGRVRLWDDQTLIAVPHRDINGNGEFDFTTEPHVDIPFTNGSRMRGDLPVDGAVNDQAQVTVTEP